jgi:hypothetical protein
VIGAIVALVVVPAGALGSTRLIVASGGGTTGNCTGTAADPACTLARGFAEAVDGDTVSLGTGTYTASGSSGVDVTHKLMIVATDPSAARPQIDAATGLAMKLDTGSDGTSVAHVALVQSAAATTTVQVLQGATFTDDSISSAAECVTVYSDASPVAFSHDVLSQTGGAGYSCLQQSGTATITLSDSAVQAPSGTAVTISAGRVEDSSLTGATGLVVDGQTALARRDTIAGTAIGAQVSGGALADSLVMTTTGSAVTTNSSGTVENVTAIGTGAGSIGFEATPGVLLPNSALTLRNSIAHAVGEDVKADVAASPCGLPPCSGGAITIDHSEFVTSAGAVTDGGGNIREAPRFTGPTDYRPARGSPAIDGGVETANTGTTDLDGNPRIFGPAPDMGAYEFQGGAPVVSTGTATKIGTRGATLTGLIDAGDEPTTATFTYGATKAYGKSKTVSLPVSAGGRAVSVQITGLEPWHTYHLQLTAHNALGTTSSTDVSFRTAALPAPRLSKVSFRPAGFRAVRRAGTRIRLRLSEAASVTVTFARRRGHRFVRVRKRLKLGTLKAGSHSIRFRGAGLSPGRYRAMFRATNKGAAHASKPINAAFTVKV